MTYDEIKYIRYKWIVNNSDQLRLENSYTSLEVKYFNHCASQEIKLPSRKHSSTRHHGMHGGNDSA